jgi:hypothetical protein
MASPSDENAYWNGGFNDALGIPLVWRDGRAWDVGMFRSVSHFRSVLARKTKWNCG